MNNKIKNLLERGVVDVIEKDSLEKKLNSSKKLRIKFGADPTAPDLHLGHAVALRKLKEFQDLGHKIIFIIGDFTAKIGDPSGKNKTRPPLSEAEIKKNTQTYLQQIGKILDVQKIKIYKNSQWFSKMKLEDLIRLSAKLTVAKILERDDFEKRIKNKIEIYYHETLYPLLQAYDSVMVEADVEIGGSDQIFNMLVGRDLQKKMGQEPQDVLTVPLLVGLDGKEKMSKSLKNYVGFNEMPQEQFGKLMSLPDELIIQYMKLLTDIPAEEIDEIEKKMKKKIVNPRDAKMRLAFEIVSFYHSEDEARKAKEEFERVFSRKEMPKEMPEVEVSQNKIKIIDFLAENSLVSSKSEARRLIEQKAVEIDGKIIGDWRKETEVKDGAIMRIGKRKFIKIKLT